MSFRPYMLRRIVSLVALLALSSQALAQSAVYADLAEPAPAQQECPCCPESAPATGCAGSCSMMTALPGTGIDLPPAPAERASRANESGSPGPAYLPLNPPPIA